VQIIFIGLKYVRVREMIGVTVVTVYVQPVWIVV